MSTNQIKNTFEREIQTIEKSFNAYSTTNDFYDVVQEPMGIRDFQKFREINSLLNYFTTFSLNGTNYSIVSVNQNWRVENGSLRQITEAEMEEFKAVYIEGRNENLYWVRGENGIISVSILPFFSRDKLAVGLAEIPIHSIDSLLEVRESSTPFYIVNRNNEIIYSANITDETAELSNSLILELRSKSDEESTGLLRSNHGTTDNSSLIYIKSDYNNWLYVTYLEQEEIDESLLVIKYGLTAVGLVLTLISILIAYHIAGRVTKPIESLKRSLSLIPGSLGNQDNDWEFISQQVNTIVTENETLQNLYDREEPELKKQFMLNLYRNRLMESELRQKLIQFQYPYQEKKAYNIMLIQIDDYGTRVVNNKDIFLIGINEIVRDLVPRDDRFTPIVLNDELQVTLLAFNLENREENKQIASDYANMIMEAAQQYMNLSISIAFSPFFDNLLMAKEGLGRGKEAMAYHLILDKQSIVYYDEIEKMISVPEISEYPENLEATLFQEVRLGEEEKAEKTATSLLDTIIGSSNIPINVQVAFLRLALSLVQLSQTLNSEILTEERGIQLYEEILQTHDFGELKYLFLQEIILPFTKEMSEKNAQQFQRLSEQIIRIIEENYTEDINLEVIGAQLHYNPNYLSNIFKKETGGTFSEYLTSFRFEAAKHWLIETDITIKKISERLQYRNPQNFIRSFKKKENMTPGEYRRMHTPE